ncbi:MAG: hypothetical protein KC418_06165 [Anaerolineales bacterium]|nr:hypothetical protein [Anaerolineales bacterium]
MAKKNFTDPDDLVSSLDDLAASKPQGARSQPARTRSKAFTDEVQVDARDIALATGDKTMAGQYKRKQILIPPAQLEYIRRKARDLRISQAELFRWLIDYGLMALDQGVQPEIEIVDVRGETRKSHWSSK